MNTKNEFISALVEDLNKSNILLPGELSVTDYAVLGGISAEGYRYSVRCS